MLLNDSLRTILKLSNEDTVEEEKSNGERLPEKPAGSPTRVPVEKRSLKKKFSAKNLRATGPKNVKSNRFIVRSVGPKFDKLFSEIQLKIVFREQS